MRNNPRIISNTYIKLIIKKVYTKSMAALTDYAVQITDYEVFSAVSAVPLFFTVDSSSSESELKKQHT